MAIHRAVHPRRIRRLHQWYLERLRELLGPMAQDLGLTLTGARWLAQRVLDAPFTRVMELGSGFSTLVLARAAAATGGELTSADHNPDWRAFVGSLLEEQGLSKYVQLVGVEEVWDRDPQLVLVDHGPGWRGRLADLPRAAEFAPQAEVYLDDWYPVGHRYWRRYGAPATEVLAALGCKPVRVQESAARGDRKHLAFIEGTPLRPVAPIQIEPPVPPAPRPLPPEPVVLPQQHTPSQHQFPRRPQLPPEQRAVSTRTPPPAKPEPAPAPAPPARPEPTPPELPPAAASAESDGAESPKRRRLGVGNLPRSRK